MAELNPALERYLRAQRESINARVAMIRRIDRRFDPERFADALRRVVDPAVAAVETLAPERAASTAGALVSGALDLGSIHAGGPDHGHLGRTLAGLPHLLLDDPLAVVATLVNAPLRLGRSGVDVDAWLDAMQRTAAAVDDVATWRRLGLIAAWRCGRSAWREAARTESQEFLPQQLAATLGCDPAEVARVIGDPWYGIDGLQVACRLGGFIGFGGGFRRPPRVGVVDGRVVAGDGHRSFVVHADAFGGELEPTAQQPGDDDGGGRARVGRHAAALGLDPIASVAATSHLVAVTLAHSHRVAVVVGLT